MLYRSLILLGITICIGIVYIVLIKLQRNRDGLPASTEIADIKPGLLTPEIVAAITAAVSVMMQNEPVKVRICSINPLNAKANSSEAWTDFGRNETMKRHNPFLLIGRWGSK